MAANILQIRHFKYRVIQPLLLWRQSSVLERWWLVVDLPYKVDQVGLERFYIRSITRRMTLLSIYCLAQNWGYRQTNTKNTRYAGKNMNYMSDIAPKHIIFSLKFCVSLRFSVISENCNEYSSVGSTEITLKFDFMTTAITPLRYSNFNYQLIRPKNQTRLHHVRTKSYHD